MDYLWSVPGLDLREEGSEECLQLAHVVSRRKVSLMLWSVNEEKVNAYLKMLIEVIKPAEEQNVPHQIPELTVAISFTKSK